MPKGGKRPGAGRPPGAQNKNKPFRAAIDAVLAAGGIVDGKKIPTLEEIAAVLLSIAYHGNSQAIKELADRLDGKVPQMLGDSDGNVLQPAAVLIVSDTVTSGAAPKAEGGEEHEGNGSSVRGRSRRR
jgi:hypothetical protein